MTGEIRPLIAGNWKMNGLAEDLRELRAIASGLSSDLGHGFDALICVPATLVSRAHDVLHGDTLALGGQDCHSASSGAHTGDISAAMLKDAGASFVIVGHSERRQNHGESDALVRQKCKAAQQTSLVAIVCVGETLNERETGKTLDVVGSQLDGSIGDDVDLNKLVVAYEPVWAIGTGKTPTLDDVRQVHEFIRSRLVERFGAAAAAIRLLYGGSVKPDNAAGLLGLQEVNGALVGGASLKAQDFLGICAACRQ